jgi:glycosyltransferase involved in cell wall biosynthesis
MASPRTSVVIPAKDRIEELERALDSVIAQTDRDFEIVVIDDGSESPLEPIISARCRDPRLRFVRQDNAGPARARNTGMSAARGTYLAFLDSDDTWERTKLARQIERFTARPELALVATNTRFVDDRGRTSDEVRLVKANAARCWELLQMTTSSVMFRRSTLTQAGGFARDLFFMEDKELFLRIGLGAPFETIPEPLTVFHTHARQTTKRKLKELTWVERYERDVRTFMFRVAPHMRPSDWRHLARKASVLEADISEMYAEHGAYGPAVRAQAIATLLSPLELDGWRRLAATARAGWFKT